MKISFLLTLFVFTSNLIQAQLFTANDSHPVKVTFSQADPNLIQATICLQPNKDWIVYDSIIGGEGPIPLEIQINNSNNINSLQIIKPKELKQKFDDVFDVKVMYFNENVCYQLKGNKANTGNSNLSLSITFMSCNLSSGMCLPPITHEHQFTWK